jgi:hypothetical protein
MPTATRAGTTPELIRSGNGSSNNRRERRELKDGDFRPIAGRETPHRTDELSRSTASPTDLLCALCVHCGFLQLLFLGSIGVKAPSAAAAGITGCLSEIMGAVPYTYPEPTPAQKQAHIEFHNPGNGSGRA